MTTTYFLLTLALLVSLCVTSWGRILHIDERLPPSTVFYQRYGAYTVKDSPFGGTTTPTVHFNLIFTQYTDPLHWNSSDINMALGEVILFHYTRRSDFGMGGFSVLEGRIYCCNKQLYDEGVCAEINTLIIDVPPSDPPISPSDYPTYIDYLNSRDDLYYLRLNWTNYLNAQRIASLDFSTTLDHTGVWYLFLADCESPNNHGVELAVTGIIEWKNPFGYLSGQILGFLPLYWITSVFYILLCFIWCIFAFKYRHDMVKLQHAITIVILISVVESLIWASNYSVLNTNGINSDATNVFAALFSSFKLTFVRTLMLVVAIGYTITRPRIERNLTIGLIILSCVYFVVEATNLYMDVAIAAGRFVDPGWKLFFFVLLIIANIVYFSWIAYEIYCTFKKLKEREEDKLMMYKRLSLLLTVCLFVSVCIVISVLIIEATENSDEHFRSAWLVQGYWELVYVACLIFVGWVWRPNSNNRRFAYGELEEEDAPPQSSRTTGADAEPNVQLDKEDGEEGYGNGDAIGTPSASSSDSSSSSEFEGSGGGAPMGGLGSGGFSGLGTAGGLYNKNKWLPPVVEESSDDDDSDDDR